MTPAAALSNSKTYTISILGGTSGVKDVAGNALAPTVTSQRSQPRLPSIRRRRR